MLRQITFFRVSRFPNLNPKQCSGIFNVSNAWMSAARSLHWRFRPTRQGGRRYRSARRYRSPCRRCLRRRAQTPATVCRCRGTPATASLPTHVYAVSAEAGADTCNGVSLPWHTCYGASLPMHVYVVSAEAGSHPGERPSASSARAPTQVSGPAPQTRAPRRPRPAPQRDRAARRRGGTADRRDCGPVRPGVEAPHISLGLGADGGGRVR